MPQRPVEIPVPRELREQIKDAKGNLTYSAFFNKILDKIESGELKLE